MKSRTLTDIDIAVAKGLLNDGWLQSDVASLLGCNGGRVAEVNSGQRGPHVAAADFASAYWRAELARLHVDWTLRIGRQLRGVVS